jgi:hypothetical protein
MPAHCRGRLSMGVSWVFRHRRRFEADNEVLSGFDLLIVEAGDLLELIERLADTHLVQIREDGGSLLTRQARHALELDARGPVDVEWPRRFAQKVGGEILEHRPEFLVGAFGAALDHVGDDFFPALTRQPDGC